ncbi:MAG: C-terminal peptidase (prc) [Acidobacteria bacterium]|jgi:carboxyl-terminal processing protease|nr:C-terminal peptidase (prc) [Acidobacteriota bacterium]
MNKKFATLAFIVVFLGALGGGLFGRLPINTSADASVSPEKITSDYREALEVVNANYVGKVDHENILDSTIQGMLWTLDPHSSFFTRDEFRKLYEEQASQFYGIGVSILQRRDGVYVQSVIPNTPADKAGIRYGDKFLQVDDKSAKDWSSAEVSKNVRGERGTTVKVQIERVSSAKPLDFEIVRGGVPLPSIRNYFMLPNGAGYIGLTGGFQETTAEELDAAIADLEKQGMKSLVLDLRGNPGGLLPQAIEVVSRFVPQGQTVVSVKGRARYAKTQELRTVGGDMHNFPLVVLINGGSASASEIVAGAVQDYGRGVIVGTDSFGKGLVQRVFPLPYGTGLTLTTARYYTPFGRSLQKDYSSGSIYDYYTHQGEGDEAAATEAKPKPAGSPVTTAGGRVLYGGRGIEPDIKVPALAYNALRYRLNEAAFYFVRQLAAGKVQGFENYKVEKQNYSTTIQPNELQIVDKLFESFRNYTVTNKENGLTAENINSQIDYAKSRLREELATANYSNEAGIQVLLENDPQVLKALEAIPEAKRFLEKNLANKAVR